MQWDLNNPNTKRLVAVMQGVWGEYVKTHTLDDIAALKRRVEEKRRLRNMVFGQPVSVQEAVLETTAD